MDEVHKVVVANAVLKGYRPHEGLWPTEYLPHKRKRRARRWSRCSLPNPDLERYADGMAAYLAGNRH